MTSSGPDSVQVKETWPLSSGNASGRANVKVEMRAGGVCAGGGVCGPDRGWLFKAASQR